MTFPGARSFQAAPYAAPGKFNMVILTTTQQWSPPPGVTQGQVLVTDGGQGGRYNTGGSGNPMPGGAAANTGVSNVNFIPGATYTATIGAGSAVALSPAAGGSSSFAGPGVSVTTANASLLFTAVPAASAPFAGASYFGSTGYGAGGVGGTDIGSGGATNGKNGVVIIFY